MDSCETLSNIYDGIYFQKIFFKKKKKKKKNSLIDVWFGSKYTSGSPLFMILPIILVAK